MSKRSTPEALTVTVALHIAAVAIMLVLGYLAEWVEEDPPVVMQLVDLSADIPLSREPSEARPTPEPITEEPAPTLEELEALDIPEFEELEPAPILPDPPPEPVEEPEPLPPPPTPRTYEDFIKNNPLQPDRSVRKPAPRPTEAPKIKTDYREELTQTLEPPKLMNSASLSAAQATELEKYVAGLQRQLQAVFRPVGPPGLKATVSFTVAPNGVFTGYRIVQTSGDPAFDAAALSAFKKVGRYRFTPDRRAYEWEIVFRSVL